MGESARFSLASLLLQLEEIRGVSSLIRGLQESFDSSQLLGKLPEILWGKLMG